MQADIRNSNNLVKKNLGKRLSLLKQNVTQNFDEILLIENQLNTLIDNELDEKLAKSKLFENLRFEKNSCAFNKIFRASKSGDNICKINLKEEANFYEFDNVQARNSYIKNFYGNIYLRQTLPDISLPDFLGEDICNNPDVLSKKLSNEERDFLDMRISLEELEISLHTANANSAPGLDGFHNKALKIFWPFIEYAILAGLNTMIKKENLTDLLKLGGIRLIPKKGELKDIGNWRPISLLSVIYKLYSGVITKRIEPFIDKICSPGQKGYRKKKDT